MGQSTVITLLLVLVIFCGIRYGTAYSGEAVPLVPRQVLFGNPEKTGVQISPDGTMIAYAAPRNNVLNLWVKTIGLNDDRPVTEDTDRGIYRYFWSFDNKHLVYLRDKGGDENWRLYAVDIAGGAVTEYTPYEKVQVRIIDRDKHFPDTLIIGMNKDNEKLHDAYSLSLSTGKLQLVAKNPGNVTEWLCDTSLSVRGCLTSLDDASVQLLVRAPESSREGKDDWKEIIRWSQEDSMTSGPVGFSKDGSRMYILDSRQANAARLTLLDLTTGAQKTVASDPHYDVADVIIDPDTYEAQAVSFVKDRNEWKVLDRAFEGDLRALLAPQNGDLFINSHDSANRHWTVGYIKDNGPVAYYLYDRATKKKEFLFFHKSDLTKYRLAAMKPVSFKSRDGLTIHGYLTLPPGQARRNLPMVLNVHGGPWVRDAWGYDAESQWLSNRGYACLQVNYRGSSGYGKDFLNAGNREWGGTMQDDLTDAVGWAVRTGIADPKRVAIFGGSYGGYAALAGAAFTPDLYCCAVDIVGPSNLLTFIDTIPPYWKTMLADFYKRVGDPRTEKEFLKSRSPLFSAARIRIPMLIAQGANDPRVNRAESEQIVKALQEKGISCEYLLFPDEGHGFVKPGNRLRFYAAAEKFLAQQLKGRYEEAKPETESTH